MAGSKRSGRRLKPTALKAIQGSRMRRQNRTEPVHPVGVPTIPPHLATDDLAVTAWGSFVERLSAVKVLTSSHGEALAIMAEAWADYVRCRQQFERMGRQLVVADEKVVGSGATAIVTRKIKDNPLIRRSERLAMLIQRYLGEFGLTPATGPKVQGIAAPEATNPLLALVSRRNAV